MAIRAYLAFHECRQTGDKGGRLNLYSSPSSHLCSSCEIDDSNGNKIHANP